MKHVIAALLSITVLCPALGIADQTGDAFTLAESSRMGRLAQLQLDTKSDLRPFSTDGCSGGLSAGWEFIASKLPAIGDRIGAEPPWSNCCTVHDRAYWKGDTANGVQKRLDADMQLRTCVQASGRAESAGLVVKWGMSREQVEATFDLAAGLMFRAVRLGGQPCSPLPWRWGYGWPACPIIHDMPREGL